MQRTAYKKRTANGKVPVETEFYIFEHERRLSRDLMIWSGMSMILGWLLRTDRTPFIRAFGEQFLLWGLIDAGIALFGQQQNAEHQRKIAAGDMTIEGHDQEVKRLENIFWYSMGFDLLVIMLGRYLTTLRVEKVRGAGWAVILQGAFLLWFDGTNAWSLNQKRDQS